CIASTPAPDPHDHPHGRVRHGAHRHGLGGGRGKPPSHGHRGGGGTSARNGADPLRDSRDDRVVCGQEGAGGSTCVIGVLWTEDVGRRSAENLKECVSTP